MLEYINVLIKMEKIQFTKGCPNQCQYCYEPKEMEYYGPKIPNEDFQILDMNFLANPDCEKILKKLRRFEGRKELVCGVDYRILTQDICGRLYLANFIKIRWAWDYSFVSGQRKHNRVWKMFLKAGYKSKELSVFILANWKIPYVDCIKKLDLLKIWNVKVNDCCFDGGYKKVYNNESPMFWKLEDIKRFRKMCRKHNQMILFKIDPELK